MEKSGRLLLQAEWRSCQHSLRNGDFLAKILFPFGKKLISY